VEILAEIEDFLEGFNQPTYRGVRINGQRVATWSSEHGWSRGTLPRRICLNDRKEISHVVSNEAA
jgi:hypothetical protein